MHSPMQAAAVYEGYSAASPVVSWFWELVLSDLSFASQKSLLTFITGSRYVCAHVCGCVFIYIYTCVCMKVTHMCMRVRVYMYTYVCEYTYVSKYTHDSFMHHLSAF